MICCDVCEDWFHGKCVHVSKAMGKYLEFKFTKENFYFREYLFYICVLHYFIYIIGQQMEEKGIEWVCPNCLRKKAEEEKMKSNSQSLPGKQKTKIESVGETSSQAVPLKEISPSSSSTDPGAAPASTMQCVVCKKEARNSSIYCSDACILAHAQETLTKEKPVPSGSNIKSTKSPVTEAMKAKPETRVVVFDRKSGKVLTGK